MHSIEVLELKKRYWIPENLGECDRRQYLDISKLLLMLQLGDINMREFRVFALYALLNMTPSKSIVEMVEEEKWENILRISELIDSFFRIDDDGKRHLIQDYIHNPVPSFKYKFQTFYGPKEAFQGFKYGQLEDGVGEMQSFHASGDFEHLLRLTAIFYLRKGESYENIDIEKRIKYFKTLDVRYVYGFYLLFVSFFNYLTTGCVISIDGRELDMRALFQKDDNGPATEVAEELASLGMRSTSFQLAESGVFGTLKELRNADGMMVLIRMYDMLVRARLEEAARKEAEQKAKSQS